jgi:hypothetical protein
VTARIRASALGTGRALSTPVIEKFPVAAQLGWPLDVHVPAMFPLLFCTPCSVRLLFVAAGNSVETVMAKCPPLRRAVSLSPDVPKQEAIVPVAPGPKLDTFTVPPDCFKSAKKVKAVEPSEFSNWPFQPPFTF